MAVSYNLTMTDEYRKVLAGLAKSESSVVANAEVSAMVLLQEWSDDGVISALGSLEAVTFDYIYSNDKIASKGWAFLGGGLNFTKALAEFPMLGVGVAVTGVALVVNASSSSYSTDGSYVKNGSEIVAFVGGLEKSVSRVEWETLNVSVTIS